MTFIDQQIIWFGQSAFRISSSSGRRLYVDVYKVPSDPVPADVILFTHPHHDHYNPKAISRLSTQETVVVVPKTMAKAGFRGINPGESVQVSSFRITVVPAYNLRNFPHGRKNLWLGYLIEVDGVRVYHAGDTDFIPEMNGLRPDIAMLPVVGFVSMSIARAVQAAKAIEPKVVLPMHYGLMPGTKRNGDKFAKAYNGVVKMLNAH